MLNVVILCTILCPHGLHEAIRKWNSHIRITTLFPKSIKTKLINWSGNNFGHLVNYNRCWKYNSNSAIEMTIRPMRRIIAAGNNVGHLVNYNRCRKRNADSAINMMIRPMRRIIDDGGIGTVDIGCMQIYQQIAYGKLSLPNLK